jgi:hypothetical protein
LFRRWAFRAWLWSEKRAFNFDTALDAWSGSWACRLDNGIVADELVDSSSVVDGSETMFCSLIKEDVKTIGVLQNSYSFAHRYFEQWSLKWMRRRTF